MIPILECADAEAAKAVIEATKEAKPVLCGANAANWEAMNAVAKTAGVVLGVSGADLNELHDTVEKAGSRRQPQSHIGSRLSLY